eukprot:4856421-Alexandrium_andersonii.AAC.1
MSASLVGSEMCIRDSHHRTNCSHHRTWLAKLTSMRSRGPSRRIMNSSNCLLYTSDAADDM